MRYIKSNSLTIEQFLEKLRTRSNFSSEDNKSQSLLCITFPTPFRWGDGSEEITSLTLHYDPSTRNISKITIIGNHLTQVVGYTYLNERYLWFTIKDIGQFDFSRIADTPGVLILEV